MLIYRKLKTFDYNESLTDEQLRVTVSRNKQNDDDGWTTVKKVNKKEERMKEQRKLRRQEREESKQLILKFKTHFFCCRVKTIVRETLGRKALEEKNGAGPEKKLRRKENEI